MKVITVTEANDKVISFYAQYGESDYLLSDLVITYLFLVFLNASTVYITRQLRSQTWMKNWKRYGSDHGIEGTIQTFS